MDFDGKVQDEGNLLYWSTASEENNDYFEIEYSTDGYDFEAIGRIEGKGTTYVQNNYNFLHEDVSKGIHYYRLKQVDLGGQITFSEIKVAETKGTDEIKIYPTLVNDRLTIESGIPFSGQSTFEIWNVLGQRVMEGRIEKDAQNFELEMSNLNNGKYFIRISQNQNQVAIHSFVKY